MDVSYVVVGKILSAHGIHGKMIIDPMTENPHRFEAGSKLHVEGEDGTTQGEVIIGGAVPYKGKLLVRLAGVTDRTHAEKFRGRYLCVPVDDLPEPEPGEYYHHQLVGLKVIDHVGEVLGVVDNIVPMPAQDVIIVRKSGEKYMVPFVDEFIKEINLGEGRIVIVRMPGLFEEA